MKRIGRFLLGITIVLLFSPAASADSKVELACAGRFRPVVDVQIELHDAGPHLLTVGIQGALPPKQTLDWLLHDCLATAIKLDSKRDIVVRAWHYKDRASAPQALEIYPKQQTLVYRASRRKVMLADPDALAERRP